MLKVGQRVKCVNPNAYQGIILGQVYTIEKIESGADPLVWVVGNKFGCWDWRFTPYSEYSNEEIIDEPEIQLVAR